MMHQPAAPESNAIAPRMWLLLALVALGVTFRMVQPYPNVSPIAALALFSGAMFLGSGRWWAVLLPLAALFAYDGALHIQYLMGDRAYPGFHSTMPAVYGSFVLIAGLGWLISRRLNGMTVIVGSLAGSVLFFVVTNFAFWTTGAMYPLTPAGLGECFLAGVPFFRSMLLGDLVYNGLLFGLTHLAVQAAPGWAAQPAAVPVARSQ